MNASSRPISRAALALLPVLLFVAACENTTGPSTSAPPGPNLSTTGSGIIMVGAGDIASCSTNKGDEQTATVVQSVLNSNPGATVFTIGDNVYDNGSATDYSNCYDPSWGAFKSVTKPTLGNHDYNTGTATPSFDYFGDAAWDNSRPNGYYSFDAGAWHIVVLNSNNSFVPTKAGSAQETWLKNDLAASTKSCTLALLHVPRFRSSSTSTPVAPKDYVRDFWVDLYNAGAELILDGDAHFYERFDPQTPDGAADQQFGLREIIVGTGGKSVGSPVAIAPNSVVQNGTTFGVIKLTLNDGSYSWQFMPVAGKTFTDQGTASCHGKPTPAPAPSTMVINDGNNQSAPVGTAVATPPSVKVTDANNNPIAGVTVKFSVTSGGGSATGTSPVTDANGIARVGSWTLGTVAGTNKLKAQIPNSSVASVTFTATGTTSGGGGGGTPDTLVINDGNNQSAPAGTAVATPPSVKVLDANNQPVAGVTVNFSVALGGGSITGANPVTDANGIARVGSWTLGTVPGKNKLRAKIANSTITAVSIIATGT